MTAFFKEKRAVKELNKVLAIVSVGGYMRIIRLNPFRFVSKKEIILEYGDKGLYWLSSSERATYKHGIGVYPNGCRKEIYNLWVPPVAKKGECKLFIDYIHNNICSGKKLRTRWLLDWLADLVQHPTEPKGCGIAINSSEGLLEDVLETMYKHHEVMNSIFIRGYKGNHELLDAYHLVGNWTGITGLLVNNMTHQIISNWKPPKRKWLILEQTDIASDKVRDELQDGGIEAFTYYLFNREIKSKLYKAPKNPDPPKPDRITTVPVWWLEAVDQGKLDIKDWLDNSLEWPRHVIKAELYANYGRWCDKTGVMQSSFCVFTLELRKITNIKEIRKAKNGVRQRLFVIPSLNRCRKRILNEG